MSFREKVHTLNNEAMAPQPTASGGYISLLVHIWVGDDGRVIRGTIEDAHTGAHLAVDLSALAALLQGSLAHTGEMNTSEEEHMGKEDL